MNLNITSYCKITEKKCILNGNDFYVFDKESQNSSVKQLYNFIALKYPKFFKMDILSKYGFIASEILISNSKTLKKYKDDEVLLLFANANSSDETDIKYQETISKNKPSPSPSLFVYTLPNIILGEIAIRNKWYGENMFFVFPKFDANFLSLYAQTLIEENNAKACIVAWINIEGNQPSVFIANIEYTEKDTDSNLLNKENLLNKYNK